jgi:hypothetical protein
MPCCWVSPTTSIACSTQISASGCQQSHIASRLPESKRTRILEEALHAARQIPWVGPFKAETMLKVVPWTCEPLRSKLVDEVLNEARGIPYVKDRLTTLASAAPYLSKKLLEQLIDEAVVAEQKHEIEDVFGFPEIISNIAPHLSAALTMQTVDKVRQVPEKYGISSPRSYGLAPLIIRLAEPGHVQEALDLCDGPDIGYKKREVLEQLALLVDPPLLRRVLVGLQAIGDHAERILAEGAIIPYLRGMRGLAWEITSGGVCLAEYV